MKLEYGVGGTEVAELGVGDFVFIPAHMIHRESVPAEGEAGGRCVCRRRRSEHLQRRWSAADLSWRRAGMKAQGAKRLHPMNGSCLAGTSVVLRRWLQRDDHLG